MKIKKGDLILVIVVIAAVLGWLVKDNIWPDTVNRLAVIKIDSEIYTSFPLDKKKEREEIHLNLSGDNSMHIVTEKGQIWVEESSCPDKVCVKTGKITKPGQSIVCLPNKTVIYIEGTHGDSNDSEIDELSY